MPATSARLTRANPIRPARVINSCHLSPLGCSRHPAATDSLIEAQYGLKAAQPCIDEVVLRLEQSLLYHEQGDKVDRPLAQPGFADIERALRGFDDLLLQSFGLRGCGNCN